MSCEARLVFFRCMSASGASLSVGACVLGRDTEAQLLVVVVLLSVLFLLLMLMLLL